MKRDGDVELVCVAPSPAATAALAIGRELIIPLDVRAVCRDSAS
jgi:hypothetical protein